MQEQLAGIRDLGHGAPFLVSTLDGCRLVPRSTAPKPGPFPAASYVEHHVREREARRGIDLARPSSGPGRGAGRRRADGRASTRLLALPRDPGRRAACARGLLPRCRRRDCGGAGRASTDGDARGGDDAPPREPRAVHAVAPRRRRDDDRRARARALDDDLRCVDADVRDDQSVRPGGSERIRAEAAPRTRDRAGTRFRCCTRALAARLWTARGALGRRRDRRPDARRLDVVDAPVAATRRRASCSRSPSRSRWGPTSTSGAGNSSRRAP